jgi:RNA polymerase sigma factor (sigma-70 family)
MGNLTSDTSSATACRFATTHWSVVLAAARDDPRGRQALDRLCRTYWRPLYFFARRHGHSPADAQDATQEFFARFLENRALEKAHPAEGRFRSYLLTSLRHFLVNEWKRGQAQKRGGGLQFISLDADSAETRYRLEPIDNATPERLYELDWAVTLLEAVMTRLQAEQEKAGSLEQFNLLRGCLMGDQPRPYRELAVRLNTTESALKMAIHRLRKRFGDLLRGEIAQTVSRPEEIDEEIRHLLTVLGRG